MNTFQMMFWLWLTLGVGGGVGLVLSDGGPESWESAVGLFLLGFVTVAGALAAAALFCVMGHDFYVWLGTR